MILMFSIETFTISHVSGELARIPRLKKVANEKTYFSSNVLNFTFFQVWLKILLDYY